LESLEVNTIWYQRRFKLPRFARGFHLITDHIVSQLVELRSLEIGLFHLFIQHTSASLTINENADPDVRVDFELAVNHLVPDGLPFVHIMEGPDDMPAHIKSSLMGASVTIPVSQGRLALGTWQGIYLCEHRDRAESRQLIGTLLGISRPE
jgi:secondary thiamine-phosphate synthase enzyme